MKAVSSAILDASGKPYARDGADLNPELRRLFVEANAAARGQSPRIARARYDAAQDTDEYRRYWANADALDADSANSKAVRHKLIHRSRYEKGSNGYYDGILKTYVNFLVGTGPTLRMQTRSRNFNRLVERDFGDWARRVELRRKLWCMAHAKVQDGEAFAILQTNPMFARGVSLDLTLIEAEQCQTPYLPALTRGYIDGIKFDEFNNVQWYDVLPYHPGGTENVLLQKAIQVNPRDMIHWFQLVRPGAHRGTVEMKSTLNLGAAFRRFREANLSTAEKVAAWTLFLKTMFEPAELQGVAPMSTQEIYHNMMTALPNSMEPVQLKAEHPSPEYDKFHRTLVSEVARPLSMPYNVSASDSSTYSFASGKLDMLGLWVEEDVQRMDCNEKVLDPIFAAFFREWRFTSRGLEADPEEIGPAHEWDWPAHPVIDDEADANSTDKRLQNGSLTLSESYSRRGKDYEDQLEKMAEDWFGEANPENIDKARKINLVRNLPEHTLKYLAPLLGLAVPQSKTQAEEDTVLEGATA